MNYEVINLYRDVLRPLFPNRDIKRFYSTLKGWHEAGELTDVGKIYFAFLERHLVR